MAAPARIRVWLAVLVRETSVNTGSPVDDGKINSASTDQNRPLGSTQETRKVQPPPTLLRMSPTCHAPIQRRSTSPVIICYVICQPGEVGASYLPRLEALPEVPRGWPRWGSTGP